MPTVERQIILHGIPPVFPDPFPVFIHFLRNTDYSAQYAADDRRDDTNSYHQLVT